MSISEVSNNTPSLVTEKKQNTAITENNLESIYLSALKKSNYFEIAREADYNGDKKLTGDEMKLFTDLCEDKGVVFDPDKAILRKNRRKNFYNKVGNFFRNIFNKEPKTEASLKYSTETKTITEDYNTEIVTKEYENEKNINKITDNINGDYGDMDVTLVTTTDEVTGNITVDFDRKQNITNATRCHEANFTYNKEMLEDYIINEATDSKGNKLYFSDVKSIREILPEERTPEQIKLLNEFENFINYVLEAGNDYGVDPKQIVAIIQKEVGFDGSKKGGNGSGYMQITTITVADMLNNLRYKLRGTEKRGFYVEKTKYEKGLKQDLYGSDIIELFNSRGFKLTNNMTKAEKDALLGEVVTYLRKNTDPEFNIRLRTIILRAKLLKNDGDFTEAARDYNGNGKIIKGSRVKDDYAKKVTNFYDAVSKDLPETTYEFS